MPRNFQLRHPVHPVRVQPRNNLPNLLQEMGQTAFQGKNLSSAVQVWKEMLQQEVTILLGLAGALIPAGMRHLLVYLIQNRLIDCLVSTGANLFHDIHETLGKYHWQGSCTVDDLALKKQGIDRIYDVFAKEEEFTQVDRFVLNFARSLNPSRAFSTREFFALLGKHLYPHRRQDGILTSAAKAGVPVYCPALGDSSIGIALAQNLKSPNFLFDILADVQETAFITANSKATGVIYLGGGTPKNFLQQTEVTATLMGLKVPGHRYAIQVTTDAPHWGGLSGCTFEEAQSWGKISEKAEKVTLYCDSTIALPLMVNALAHEKKIVSERVHPEMKKLWSRPAKIDASAKGKRAKR